MSDYATPPSSKKSEGRNAFAEHTREWSSGRDFGYCMAASSTIGRLGPKHRESLELIRFAERRGWLDLLRKACRKRGVNL